MSGAAVGTRATGPTDQLLRRLVLDYRDAQRSGRDEPRAQLRRDVQDALATGLTHGDLVLLLVQLQLDDHDLTAAGSTLARFPGAAATPSGQALRAGLHRQRGELAAAGAILLPLAAEEHSATLLSGVAALYDDLDEPGAADWWYASAADQLDAKQLSMLAHLEVQRARLRRTRGDLVAAAAHLHVAEQVAPHWSVSAERARWHTADGQPDRAAVGWRRVVDRTGRPDHWQELGAALAAGRDEAGAAAAYATARRGYDRAASTPWRYLHHQVGWHLEHGGDHVEALRLARLDHGSRPNPHTTRALAAVLRATGAEAEASALLKDAEARRRDALAALRRLVDRLTASASGATG